MNFKRAGVSQEWSLLGEVDFGKKIRTIFMSADGQYQICNSLVVVYKSSFVLGLPIGAHIF